MTKAELHRLVDALPAESLAAAAILLQRAQDPLTAKLDAAPYDDEELTDEDLRALKEARSGPGISWSDAETELNAVWSQRIETALHSSSLFTLNHRSGQR